jgi:TolB-like protein/tetratricopeptide (TPR) repeat protein
VSSLFARLRERKIVQWALAYLAGAWIVVQLLDAVSEPLSLSPNLHRAILILLGIGFFIALVVAWYHGEKGRQRVSGPELLMVAALLVAAGVAISFLGGPAPPPGSTNQTIVPPTDGRPRVAVLPCTNESPDPEDTYRAGGLHDEILLRLQKISSLASIGRQSVLRYGAEQTQPSEVAAALSAGWIGQCTVQRESSRFRVIFQLLDASGVQVLAEVYDQELGINILDIQVQIAERIADAIGVVVLPEESGRLAARPTQDFRAWNLYRRGQNRWMMRQEGWAQANSEAIEYFEAAVAEDPSFALAHAGLSQALMTSPGYGGAAPHEVVAAARKAAADALSLDPDLPEAHAARGYIAYAYDWDWSEAERRFLRAIALNPGDAETRARYSLLLRTLQREEEAHEQASIALDFDPLSWSATLAMAWAQGGDGSEDGIRAVRQFLRHFPNSPGGHLNLSLLLLQRSRFEEAGDEAALYAEPFSSVLPPDSLRVLYQAMADPATWGHAEGLLQFFQDHIPGPQNEVVFYYAMIGNSEKVLELARRLMTDRSLWVPWLGYSWFSSLFDDPRYLALLDEIGLPRPKSGG